MPKPKPKSATPAEPPTPAPDTAAAADNPADAPPADVTVPFKDHDYTFPRDVDEWPTPAYLAFLAARRANRLGEWLTFVETLLGPAQWQLLVSSTQTGEFREFLDLIAEAIREKCEL
ncbi:hypothetical protein KL864_27020 [Mycolicibacterium goodii]|uniref:hypothetical protein n=1 Tax=Mycolicibacterium goodii TaxID=134601 RepID=UPI001BDDB70C|nr:hypothetical protein [Mycolicibacterium goodii]MBU8819542.1 hypothetical protein [Mycolicibacterium goodii]